ncbi:RNA polymerase sigma factor [Paenibacillus eucommiae]|uniref:RNA polymerase sigma-70 factor (ECF subfamily) n=1 Tax=Paenibacillus eucommiae TaxID=1355755 RepID=A0ABS4J5P0_9BACL|nr:RNA polymerase sigma factor [Paenibacillus eucommiae]MBP1995169.1 RNA polymerase sigma-70 factor (ECF subfamily) [Paenibacillus eucommiae]
MQSDEELIKELQQNIQSSMEVLIKRHYKMVFAYIYRYSGDYHTSYDLTQETFIKMVRSIDSLTQYESFKHWLLKIALNTCRDYVKSRGYRNGQASSEWNEAIADSSAQLVDMFEKKVETAAVKAALLELPPYQRETIILRFYQDLKIKEIADLSAVGEPTVKSRIKQGLSKLKAIMERSVTDDRKKHRK